MFSTTKVFSRGLNRCVLARRAARFNSSSSLSTFTAEEEMFRDTVRRFARDKVAPLSAKMDESAVMDRDVIDGLFANGLMAIELEHEYGGAGASFTSAILTIEELAKVDPAVSVCCDVQNTLVVTGLRQWGSEEQKQEWLPRLAADTIGSFCLSEVGSGSDAFAMAATAKDNGDHWLLNGTKMWITNAAEAGVFLVFANVDHSLGYKGITCFVVPRDTPGLEVGPKENKLGIRASSTCPVILTDVKLPKSAVLGQVGKGYKYAIETLNEGRIGIGAQMLGLAQGAFDATVPYLLERKQFNTKLIDFQAVEHQVAEMEMQIEATRLLVYNAARVRAEGKPFLREAAMAKLAAARCAMETSAQGIALLGGVGFMKDFPLERYYRDAPISMIYEGSSNIQLTTIAKEVKKRFE